MGQRPGADRRPCFALALIDDDTDTFAGIEFGGKLKFARHRLKGNRVAVDDDSVALGAVSLPRREQIRASRIVIRLEDKPSPVELHLPLQSTVPLDQVNSLDGVAQPSPLDV